MTPTDLAPALRCVHYASSVTAVLRERLEREMGRQDEGPQLVVAALDHAASVDALLKRGTDTGWEGAARCKEE
jgi:hypothetical protein